MPPPAGKPGGSDDLEEVSTLQVSVHVFRQRGTEAAQACLEHVAPLLPEGTRLRLLCDGARAEAPAGVDVWPVPPGHGLAAAHNRGLRRAFSGAGDDCVLVLSEDARPEPGFLEPLLEVMKWRPRCALVSPKIVLPGSPERLWYAGGRIDWWRGRALRRGGGTADPEAFDRPGPTEFATAVAMLVRNQAFDRAGAMDESYGDHLHDVAWSARARQVGMEVHYQPRSRVRYAPAVEAAGDRQPLPAPSPGGLDEAAPEAPRTNRLRLVAHHGRWYHWSATGARLAAEATRERLRQRRASEGDAREANAKRGRRRGTPAPPPF